MHRVKVKLPAMQNGTRFTQSWASAALGWRAESVNHHPSYLGPHLLPGLYFHSCTRLVAGRETCQHWGQWRLAPWCRDCPPKASAYCKSRVWECEVPLYGSPFGVSLSGVCLFIPPHVSVCGCLCTFNTSLNTAQNFHNFTLKKQADGVCWQQEDKSGLFLKWQI